MAADKVMEPSLSVEDSILELKIRRMSRWIAVRRLRSDVTPALIVPRSRDLACGEERILWCSERSSVRSLSLKYSLRRALSSMETCESQHEHLVGELATNLFARPTGCRYLIDFIFRVHSLLGSIAWGFNHNSSRDLAISTLSNGDIVVI
jgi:hypothetical protein